jgi:hypothetical protein
MEEPNKSRYIYLRPKDGAVVSVDDVNDKPGEWDPSEQSERDPDDY